VGLPTSSVHWYPFSCNILVTLRTSTSLSHPSIGSMFSSSSRSKFTWQLGNRWVRLAVISVAVHVVLHVSLKHPGEGHNYQLNRNTLRMNMPKKIRNWTKKNRFDKRRALVRIACSGSVASKNLSIIRAGRKINAMLRISKSRSAIFTLNHHWPAISP